MCIYMGKYVCVSSEACLSQQRASEPLGQELQVVMIHSFGSSAGAVGLVNP